MTTPSGSCTMPPMGMALTNALSPEVLEPLLVAGIALIAHAARTYAQGTVFPYLNALVPCVSAALVLYAGTTPTTGWVLCNPVATGVGRISYSIYLLHWLLIVLFGAYTDAAPRTGVEKGGVLLASLVGAAALNHAVERPFRRGAPSRWSADSPQVSDAAESVRTGPRVARDGARRRTRPGVSPESADTTCRGTQSRSKSAPHGPASAQECRAALSDRSGEAQSDHRGHHVHLAGRTRCRRYAVHEDVGHRRVLGYRLLADSPSKLAT